MQDSVSATFSNLHLDDLENKIITLSFRINASEYQFLVLLREFDLRQGWKALGYTDCASWLNFRCGIVHGTVWEQIRTVRVLLDLPLLCSSFDKADLTS